MVGEQNATKASVLAAARKRWGKGICLEESKRAATPEEKLAARGRLAEIRARLDAIKAERDAIYLTWKEWVKAARFALDVNLGEPSRSQLVAAVDAKEREDALAEEKKDLEKERSGLQSVLLRRRYSLSEIERVPGIGGMSVVHAYADTLEELAERIGRKD